jgi:dCMP deaminase
MNLAHVVKERSNCLKQSVGAIIVINNRIGSTGYNGVLGKFKNCYEGGCKQYCFSLDSSYNLDECNCIHAEEAAFIEIGANKTHGATIYLTHSLCRWCTKAIVAARIIRILYDEKYTQFAKSKNLLDEVSIIMDCVCIKP